MKKFTKIEKNIGRAIEKDKEAMFQRLMGNADPIDIIEAIDNFTLRIIEESFYFAHLEQQNDGDFISKELPSIMNRYLKDRKKEMVQLLNKSE